MAKRRPSSTADATPAGAAPPAVPTDDDIALACRAIRSMYGCGVDTAAERVRRYPNSVIIAMATEERNGRRDRIPAMLANTKLLPAHA